jgi:hypothetical protein
MESRRTSMTKAEQAEPPSLFRPPVFMIGQDRRGNWVVQEQKANAGGLFVTREAALRYVRSECGYQPRAVIMVSGNLELDMKCAAGRGVVRDAAPDSQRWRRIA